MCKAQGYTTKAKEGDFSTTTTIAITSASEVLNKTGSHKGYLLSIRAADKTDGLPLKLQNLTT